MYVSIEVPFGGDVTRRCFDGFIIRFVYLLLFYLNVFTSSNEGEPYMLYKLC